MQNSADSIDRPPVYIPAEGSEVAKVAATGIVAGVAVAVLAELISRYFIDPVFCRSADTLNVCSSGDMTAFYAATVIVSIAAVAVLATIGVFRPLVLGAAAAVAFWGVKTYLGDLGWLEYGAWIAAFFGFGYVLFYWLLRARSFVLSLILTALAVVLIRFIFSL